MNAHKREYRLKNRKQIREYERTPAGKAARNRYRLSENGKLSGQQYVRRRREKQKSIGLELTNAQAKLVRQKFGHKCFNCGSTERLEIDHHRPLSDGYGLTLENAVLLCRSCNASKLNKPPEKFYTYEQILSLAEILAL
jgi:5-methylcytosine-specific restriction endonuclease McrA